MVSDLIDVEPIPWNRELIAQHFDPDVDVPLIFSIPLRDQSEECHQTSLVIPKISLPLGDP